MWKVGEKERGVFRCEVGGWGGDGECGESKTGRISTQRLLLLVDGEENEKKVFAVKCTEKGVLVGGAKKCNGCEKYVDAIFGFSSLHQHT